MKTSLVCLLLLAAVACAAPQAGEMPGAKRAGMVEKMREKMAVEKREEAVNAVAAAKSVGEAESRNPKKGCDVPCESQQSEVGCWEDLCEKEEITFSEYYECWCCTNEHSNPYC